jgi:uncharacterized protein YdeI (YjbR/CyaY-like superfamily)
MEKPEIETFYPASQKQWRSWLQKNHAKKDAVWVIFYKKSSGKPTLSWSESVDEALCFGWIDSTKKTLDEERSIQFFSKRKAKSTWSKINKAKVERLADEGLMMPAGLASIERAKENGSWTILDTVEELTIPKELEKAFKSRPGSKDFFLSLSKSVRKMMLHRIVMAKREETREKRIAEIADSMGEKKRMKGF